MKTVYNADLPSLKLVLKTLQSFVCDVWTLRPKWRRGAMAAPLLSNQTV